MIHIVKNTKEFLNDLPQKCMYLEWCVLPSLYKEILEQLLQYFESANQPVHTVELLCLLGHESRKVGNRARYEMLMAKAITTHSEWHTEFTTETLSDFIYLHSYACFLSGNKEPDKPKDVCEITLKICMKNSCYQVICWEKC